MSAQNSGLLTLAAHRLSLLERRLQILGPGPPLGRARYNTPAARRHLVGRIRPQTRQPNLFFDSRMRLVRGLDETRFLHSKSRFYYLCVTSVTNRRECQRVPRESTLPNIHFPRIKARLTVVSFQEAGSSLRVRHGLISHPIWIRRSAPDLLKMPPFSWAALRICSVCFRSLGLGFLYDRSVFPHHDLGRFCTLYYELER